MIYLAITIVCLWALKVYAVYKLRYKRDLINLTTLRGKHKCIELNKTIDILTGAWLWSFRKRK